MCLTSNIYTILARVQAFVASDVAAVLHCDIDIVAHRRSGSRRRQQHVCRWAKNPGCHMHALTNSLMQAIWRPVSPSGATMLQLQQRRSLTRSSRHRERVNVTPPHRVCTHEYGALYIYIKTHTRVCYVQPHSRGRQGRGLSRNAIYALSVQQVGRSTVARSA